MKTHSFRRQGGFALLENMFSVLLLSIGALGIAVSTATTIKVNVDNLQRSMALNAASTALEGLYIAAVKDAGVSLKSSLEMFVPSDDQDSGSSGYTVSANADESGNNRDVFVVKVLEAVDAAGTDVLNNAAPYVSPVTVAVQVDYQGIGGRNVSGVEEIKSTTTSFTFVLGS